MTADRLVADDYYEIVNFLPGVLKSVAADNQALSFESSNEMLSCKMTEFMTGWSKDCIGQCAKDRLPVPIPDRDADRMGLPRHRHQGLN